MNLGAKLLQLIGQRLGASAAGVHDDQHGARRQVGGGGGDQRDGVLACLRGGFQHHHPLVGEQRRAQQFGQLAGADLTRAQAIDRNVVGAGLLARVAQHRRRPPARPAALRRPAPGAGAQPLDSPHDRVMAARQARHRPREQAHHRAACRRCAPSASATTPPPRHRPRATVTTPSSPDGTGIDAPGTPAAQCATRSSHHSSGPVNRISNSRARRPQRTQRGRRGADHGDRRDHRGDGQVGGDRHDAERAGYPGHQRAR